MRERQSWWRLALLCVALLILTLSGATGRAGALRLNDHSAREDASSALEGAMGLQAQPSSTNQAPTSPPTATRAPTRTATHGPSPTPTRTATDGPSPTPTGTATDGPSPTHAPPTSPPTATRAPTRTATHGPSPTPTRTATDGPSPTHAPSTLHPTPTSRPTRTISPTPSATRTSLPVTNVLRNRGFERDSDGDGTPDSWSRNRHAQRSSVLVYGGSYALRHASSSESSYSVSQRVHNLQGGRRYRLGGWTNIPPTGDTFSYELDVLWLNASGTPIRADQSARYTAPTGGWVWASHDHWSPPHAASAQVIMRVTRLSGTIYVDDLVFGPVGS